MSEKTSHILLMVCYEKLFLLSVLCGAHWWFGVNI